MHASTFLAIEFLLAFVELVIDSIQGILMRLNDTVIDGITTVAGTGWWPNPLHDQHLAGDLLWFIAEAADVPVLILLLLRWARRDRAEAADFDALTDAEHDALVQAHLRGARAPDRAPPADAQARIVRSAASTTFVIRSATVIGPTPPGFGDSQPATSSTPGAMSP